MGDLHLGHGYFLARAAALVKHPCRVHGEQPTDLDLLRHFAEFDLYAFAVAEFDTEAFAFRDVSLRNFHTALGKSEPAHAMRQSCRTKPDLRNLESVAFFKQQILSRNFQPVELEFAMAAMLMRPHDGDAPHESPAWLVLVEQKRCQTTPLVLAGTGNKNEMPRPLGAGGKPLAPLDDIAVAFFLGPGPYHRWIGTTTRRRLRHREARAQFALDDRLEPFVLLLAGAHKLEQVHVAVVGRHAVEGKWPKDRTRGFLVDCGPRGNRQSHAAIFLRRLRSP